jgi:hypothetical protein
MIGDAGSKEEAGVPELYHPALLSLYGCQGEESIFNHWASIPGKRGGLGSAQKELYFGRRFVSAKSMRTSLPQAWRGVAPETTRPVSLVYTHALLEMPG